LRKVYGDKVAVSNLCLEVPRGEIFGFLGPNGAGKSTSMRMLLGLARPTSGKAWVLGCPAGDVATRRRIGFLPEDFRFYQWLTASELLDLHGRLCGVPAKELRQRVPALIDLVGLGPHRDRQLDGFSKGMLQRIGLAQALVHKPDLIFLDEPTSGLDPMGRRLVRDIIRSQRDRGATVFINSHLLSEIEITCDQVVFLREGEVVAGRDLRTVKEEEVCVAVRVGRSPDQILGQLAPLTTSTVTDGDRLTFTARSRESLPQILRCLVASGADIYEFTPRRMSLEEMFISIMGRDGGM
jgi:ABC-2 type transport system ATP-binding protein